MAIRYAGVTLLLDGSVGDDRIEDDEEAVRRSNNLRNWIKANIPLTQHFAGSGGFAPHPAWAWPKRRQFFEPVPEINTLYWPTGSSRWSVGYFLGTKEIVEQCIANSWVNGVPRPATLFMGDEPTEEAVDDEAADQFWEHIECDDMYLLPPIPLAWVNPDDELVTSEPEQLYLMILVDERYWWRWTYGLDEDINRVQSWGDLLAAAAGSGVISLGYEGFDAAYLSADIDSIRTDMQGVDRHFIANHVNRPVSELVDMIAINTGTVLIANYGGIGGVGLFEDNPDAAEDGASLGYVMRSWLSSSTIHRMNCNRNFKRIAGLDSFSPLAFPDAVEALLPETLEMCFRKRHTSSGRILLGEDGSGWHKIEQATGGGMPNLKMRIYDTCIAKIDDSSDPETISNQGVLESLTSRVSQDLGLAVSVYLDVVLAGICRYEPTGFSDVIIFKHRYDECSTRIISQPWNWFPTLMNHQHGSFPRPLDDVFEAVLAPGETLERGGSARALWRATTAVYLNVASGSSANPPDEFTIFDAWAKIPAGMTIDEDAALSVYVNRSRNNIDLDDSDPDNANDQTQYILLSFDCDTTS